MSERSQSGLSVKFDDATILFSRKTEFSQVDLLATPEFGRVLLMDGEVQFAESDEHRYHEMLIHPLMDVSKKNAKVLILGGGDGLAAREVLKWEPESVTIVDWDCEFMMDVAESILFDLNNDSLFDERMRKINMNALTFVRNTETEFDVIVIDLPDPEGIEMVQLYTDIIFASQRCLSDQGTLVMHIGPLSLNSNHDCWKILRGFVKTVNHVYGYDKLTHFRTAHIPSFTHPWGFLYMVPRTITVQRNSIEMSSNVISQCRYWDLDSYAKDISRSSKFYIGDKDINACVCRALPCGSYAICECAVCDHR